MAFRWFYARARQARTGLAQTATLGRRANCKNTTRAGMSGVVSRWLGGAGALPDIAERLLRQRVLGTVEALVEAEPHGELAIKGLAKAVPVYDVRRLKT